MMNDNDYIILLEKDVEYIFKVLKSCDKWKVNVPKDDYLERLDNVYMWGINIINNKVQTILSLNKKSMVLDWKVNNFYPRLLKIYNDLK